MDKQPPPNPTEAYSPGGDSLSSGLASVPRVHLRDPREEITSPPIVLPGTPEMPGLSALGGSAGRHQILGEIARGGMGAILKGRDTVIGRDVAIKVLLETHRNRIELAQRFIEEAQITGQLQHPGIAPVYEMGMFADRRPYFTMKLVKGKTLAALLHERRSMEDGRPRFLAIFEQVCQTLAYGHARGVIHRDLKPSNVMVGAFGEVQVMDWGLAKVLREGGATDEARAHSQPDATVIHTQRGHPEAERESGSQTLAGSVLGTPAYMAPEQARGHVELVDERADVFGLGAILCEILTGQPPFTGTGAEVRRKAETARLDEALDRLDGCGADRELVGLAKRCLGAEPWDRPRHAGEVARAVTDYQHSASERLRHAELAQAAELARAEEALATTIQERRAREAAEGRSAAERRSRRLGLALAAAGLAFVVVGGVLGGRWWQQQTAAARDVQGALAQAAAHREAGRWPDAQVALERAEERLTAGAPEALRTSVRQARADANMVAELDHIRLGLSQVYKGEGVFDAGEANRLFAKAFQDYGIQPARLPAAEAAARVRAAGIREALLAGLDDWIRVEPGDGKRSLRAVADAADDNPWRLQLRGALMAPVVGQLEKIAQQPEALEQPPAMLVWLADALTDSGKTAAAVAMLKRAQARYPGDFWINFSLGVRLFWRVRPTRPEEAAVYFRVAVALRPTSSVAHSCLGGAMTFARDLDGGLVEIRRALELDPNLAAGHVNLAMNFSERKQVDKALAELRSALELDPASATVHNNLGALLNERGEHDEAISELRKALALQPRNIMARANLAGALAAKHDWHGALTEYRRRIEMDPGAVEGHIDLARYLADRSDLDGAIAELRRAVQLDLLNAEAHHQLGLLLHDRGRPTEAVAELRTACRLRPTWADPHTHLARFFLEGQDVAAALTEINLAVALEPESGQVQRTLADVLVAKGAPEEARLAWERALERSPASHDLWNGYAELCLFLGKDDAYRMARRDLLRHFGGATQPNIAERVGRACLLLPASADELKQAVALIDRAFAAGPQHGDYPYFQAAKALAEYRRDRPERALPLLREAAPRVGGNVSPNARLLQAMTLWRLGQKKAGREMFVFAVPDHRWSRPGDPDLWIHHVLRREAEAMIVPEMPAFLKGNYRPGDAAGWAALTSACYGHGLFVTMARRLGEAIAADPNGGEEPPYFLRYSAACACALAGAGQGEEARALSPDERAIWRRQALHWLQAELASRGKQLDRADRPTSAQLWSQLQSWIRDTDLTRVRDRSALAELPDAEQKAWRTFWSDVKALSKKAETQARAKK